METHEQRGPGSRLCTWTLPAALLTAVGLLATSWARGLPTPCPAIMPPPASCAPQAREATGLTGSIVLVLLVTVVLVVGATVPPSVRRRPLALAFLALGAAVTAVPVVTLVASGFSLDGRSGSVVAASAFAAVLTVVRLLPRPSPAPPVPPAEVRPRSALGPGPVWTSGSVPGPSPVPAVGSVPVPEAGSAPVPVPVPVPVPEAGDPSARQRASRPRTLFVRDAGLVLAAVLGVLVLVSLGARALAVLSVLGS